MDKTQHFGGGGMLRDPRNTKLNPSPEKKLSPAFKAATAFALIAMVCIVIAFASPNWLEHDKRFTQYQLKNLGLWEVCFKGFRHPYQTLDKVYSGCWWVFSRYFDDLLDYIEKGFFITVQVFMSLGFLLFFIAMAMLIPVFLRLFDIDTEISVTFVMAGTMLLSFFFHFMGLVIFAFKAKDSDWMPHWKWNYLSWSFAAGIIGALFQLACAILYLVDCSGRKRYVLGHGGGSKRNENIQFNFGAGRQHNINNNNMPPRPLGTHISSSLTHHQHVNQNVQNPGNNMPYHNTNNYQGSGV